MATMTRVALIGALMMTATACQQQAAAPANDAVANAEVASSEPLNGTWKADLASVKIDEKPTVVLLKDGN